MEQSGANEGGERVKREIPENILTEGREGLRLIKITMSVSILF